LLHGQPGTGKSTYIRYLLQRTKKKVLFLSPALASNLDNPSLMSLLLVNRESIVIIEDAEELLVSRDNQKNDAISTILNLTDGILGSSLGIQFIATFNTHIRNIDKALLRKGRLAAMYEFKALSAEKATALMKSLDSTSENVQEPMTLAEIYHAAENNNMHHQQSRTPIGFSVRQIADV
jgi:ATP-dependent 26S proteasome regulatory subunit